jgi:hypothetical protein
VNELNAFVAPTGSDRERAEHQPRPHRAVPQVAHRLRQQRERRGDD